MRFIDLFAGCGGMSKGMELAGMECVGFVEFWQPAIETHLRNCRGAILGKDITKITDDEIRKIGAVDLIVGGPPCQGFSMAGRRRAYDKRNRLFEEFVRFTRILKPAYFVMENVMGIGSMRNVEGGFVIEEVFASFRGIGYEVECKVLNSQNYGVPEARKRAIFLGNKVGMKNEFPDFRQKVFLKNVLDLPYNKMEGIQHVYEDMATKSNYKFSHVKEGNNYGSFKSNFIKLKMDGFSRTITKSGRYIHPKYNRFLSVREEARIQSFPDDFIFVGSIEQMYQQIGNAVPVLMAKAIGESILNMDRKLNEAKT